ncbi:DUF3107 domain-containing protein [Leucobacter sp. GX24907]
MEVRIGLSNSPRELAFESDASSEELRSTVERAIAEESVLSLKDSKGRQFLVNIEAVLYVEIGADLGRKVGFVS